MEEISERLNPGGSLSSGFYEFYFLVEGKLDVSLYY
jgi:hypothetical protein